MSSKPDDADLVSQMANMTMGLSGLPVTGTTRDSTIPTPLRYNSEWWLSENLDALVRLLNPLAAPEVIVLSELQTSKLTTSRSLPRKNHEPVLTLHQLMHQQ